MKRPAAIALALSTAMIAGIPGLLHAANDTSMMGAGQVLTGPAAFGSAEDNKPGVQRLIKPEDLPAPFVTKSASNAPSLVPRPADTQPAVIGGFKVKMVASDFEQPRVIRTAPNGDLFVADSSSNEIRATGPADSGRRIFH